jgi:small subunit ribosomal protein S7
MARRKRVFKKEVRFDGKYASTLVARLIGRVMRDGKKTIAERIVYNAIEKINEGTDAVDPLELFNKAMENAKPRLEVKSRRVGGATYQVPIEVSPDRQEALAIRWLVTFAARRKGVPMHVALANELKDAASGQGNAVRRRDEVHKMAQANRAFAHFRF